MDREMKECIVKIRYGMEIGYGQEIVRCKDCRHHDDDYPCELHTIDGSAHDDWFCADGVKK